MAANFYAESEARVQVKVVQKGLVQPSCPSPLPWLPLSPCDALMRHVNYTRRLLFYRRPLLLHSDYSALVRCLQLSLAQALAYFYPLAGRLAVHDGCLAVRCNDDGAEFVQAAILDAPINLLSQLESGQFTMQPFFSDLTRWASYSPSLHEGSAPLLSIQVTRFPCGGIALGVALSHVIADGTSFWHFMSSWVECASGKTPSLLPVHKRTLLTPNATLWHGCKATTDFYETLHDQGDTQDDGKMEKAFSFSQDMVQKLKEATKHQYSSYEVTCAHIWKHTSSARSYPTNTKVGFINVVNMRERVDPPLPKGYFGNALLWSMAIATTGDLEEEDLSSTAARIHAAILACSNLRMQEFLHLIDIDPCTSHKILQPLHCNGVRMRVSSSTKFPVFHINFGWGTPLAARSAAIEETNKLAFYPGTHGPGSIALCLALPAHAMKKLEGNPCFLNGEYPIREEEVVV